VTPLSTPMASVTPQQVLLIMDAADSLDPVRFPFFFALRPYPGGGVYNWCTACDLFTDDQHERCRRHRVRCQWLVQRTNIVDLVNQGILPGFPLYINPYAFPRTPPGTPPMPPPAEAGPAPAGLQPAAMAVPADLAVAEAAPAGPQPMAMAGSRGPDVLETISEEPGLPSPVVVAPPVPVAAPDGPQSAAMAESRGPGIHEPAEEQPLGLAPQPPLPRFGAAPPVAVAPPVPVVAAAPAGPHPVPIAESMSPGVFETAEETTRPVTLLGPTSPPPPLCFKAAPPVVAARPVAVDAAPAGPQPAPIAESAEVAPPPVHFDAAPRPGRLPFPRKAPPPDFVPSVPVQAATPPLPADPWALGPGTTVPARPQAVGMAESRGSGVLETAVAPKASYPMTAPATLPAPVTPPAPMVDAPAGPQPVAMAESTGSGVLATAVAPRVPMKAPPTPPVPMVAAPAGPQPIAMPGVLETAVAPRLPFPTKAPPPLPAPAETVTHLEQRIEELEAKIQGLTVSLAAAEAELAAMRALLASV